MRGYKSVGPVDARRIDVHDLFVRHDPVLDADVVPVKVQALGWPNCDNSNLQGYQAKRICA